MDMTGTEQVLPLSPGGAGQLADVYDAAQRSYRRIQPPPAEPAQVRTVAVLDSGVLSAHPDIAPRLLAAVDMTGQGVQDELGHGTRVALVWLTGDPGVRLISVKIIGTGANQPDWLVDGLDHVAAREDVDLVHVPAGVYRPDCTGHCTVCEAARRVAASGKRVVVAEGTVPGMTACPAKAGDVVEIVAATDPTPEPPSHPGPAAEWKYHGHTRRAG